ncbi:MAG: S8 family serine peptidase [Desulfitobacteriaceae bacterium]
MTRKKLNFTLGVVLSIVLMTGLTPVNTGLPQAEPGKPARSLSANPTQSIVPPPAASQEPVSGGKNLAGRISVRLAPGTEASVIAAKAGAEVLKKGPLNYATFRFPSNKDTAQVLTELKQIPGVETAAPSRLYKVGEIKTRETNLTESASVNIAAVSSLGTVSDPGYKDQWSLDKAGVPKAWELGATGEGITIAVIDTGVDTNHPDLKDKLVPGYNAITGSTDSKYIRDNNGHGTHVAGIAAAARNSEGIVGVAYNAKIMPIKAMDRYGEGTDDVIADGIVWAADHGAQIINLSLGSDNQGDILKEAIAYARAQGSLITAAAGNLQGDNTDTAGIDYPAADPDVIAVTATDQNDKIASFSKTGPQAVLAAPGVNILSDYWSSSRSGYAYSDGTSMASPFVAGVAALVWSKHPDWSAEQVRTVLETSAADLGPAGRDDSYGYGRINADWAVSFADEPLKVTSPAALNWAGGSVQEAALKPVAELNVPPRAFSSPDQSVTVVLSKLDSPSAFPNTITPGGPAFSVQWGEMSPQKLLNLKVNADPSVTTDNRLGYLYRWSGTRWLQVGGGVSSAYLTVGIFEPGTYRLGYVSPPASTRIAGLDRIETALEIARAAFPTGADTVILARADDFPDALAGAPLAYKYHAPILLTDTKTLREDVYAEIKTLAPHKIMLLGGEGAISEDIAGQLRTMASVDRFGGLDRYATAAAIAQALGSVDKAVVVNGENFPDAISIAAIAARQGIPILLTPAATLAPVTDNLLRRYAVTDTTVIGGDGVVSAALLEQLPHPTRLSGLDRYATAAAVLQAFEPSGQAVYVATGENFPDALTGGVLAASQGTDIILVPPSGPTDAERAVLAPWQGKEAFALGGSGVITDSVLQTVQEFVR